MALKKPRRRARWRSQRRAQRPSARQRIRLFGRALLYDPPFIALDVVVATLFFLVLGFRPVTFAYAAFGSICVLLTYWDIHKHLLPTRLIYRGLEFGALTLVASAVIGDDWFGDDWLGAEVSSALMRIVGCALGWSIGWGSMRIVWHLARSGIGYGDVRLSGYIGLHVGYLSPLAVLTSLTLGFAAAAVAGLVIAVRTRSLRTRFALGPYLIASSIAVICFTGYSQFA